jgi:hypothetical protein
MRGPGESLSDVDHADYGKRPDSVIVRIFISEEAFEAIKATRGQRRLRAGDHQGPAPPCQASWFLSKFQTVRLQTIDFVEPHHNAVATSCPGPRSPSLECFPLLLWRRRTGRSSTVRPRLLTPRAGWRAMGWRKQIRSAGTLRSATTSGGSRSSRATTVGWRMRHMSGPYKATAALSEGLWAA